MAGEQYRFLMDSRTGEPVQLRRVLRAGPGGALPAVTAVLAGALASIGAYGLLRFEAGLRW